mmetsp:Transcript_20785/g.62432  ORF Transcript_20785/g.62432 Transcript_20785/m.62432 type:complete len:562 (-) Transcript_20785:54-1739(-)
MAEAWKAEFVCTVPSTFARGEAAGRLASAVSVSRTSPTAPAPRIMPLRRLSKGSAASAADGRVEAAPRARKPVPIQGRSESDEGLSAEMTTTRAHRPARSQSQAREMAAVVPAQAALMCRFGPRAPTSSASCELAMTSSLKRSLRLNSYRGAPPPSPPPLTPLAAAAGAPFAPAAADFAPAGEAPAAASKSTTGSPASKPAQRSRRACRAGGSRRVACASSSSARERLAAPVARANPSVMKRESSSTSESRAGKEAAKMTPVSSRCLLSSLHGLSRPLEPGRGAPEPQPTPPPAPAAAAWKFGSEAERRCRFAEEGGPSTRPASCSAWRPAPMARAYVVSSVSTIRGSTPKSAARSNPPIRDAICTTSCSAESGRRSRSPVGLLETWTTFLASWAWTSGRGRGSIRLSPRSRACRFVESKTRRPLALLGSPTEMPLTKLSPRCSPSARTRRASASDAGLVSAVPVSSRLLLTAFAAVASTGGGQAVEAVGSAAREHSISFIAFGGGLHPRSFDHIRKATTTPTVAIVAATSNALTGNGGCGPSTPAGGGSEHSINSLGGGG